jgi:hypothetical protein
MRFDRFFLCLDLASDESARGADVPLVGQVRNGDAGAALADVVAVVADGEDLGGGDGAEGLALLWVAEEDDWRLVRFVLLCVVRSHGRTSCDLGGVGGRGAACGVVHELRALAVAGEDDLGAGAAGGGLVTRTLVSMQVFMSE